MKNFLALFLICFCLGACEQQSIRDTNFVNNEREYWESQKHTSCDKLFGFAYGYWNYRGKTFDWIATADPDGYIIIKTNRVLPEKFLRRFIGLGASLELTVNSKGAVIRILNNEWTATHGLPGTALEEELLSILQKTGLDLRKTGHHTFR